ncbi:MAG: sugar isomerase [Candidatus Marinimicrobia bacterium]|nr:sugar isomerase [Candidatus Neomarinimicrobiota bacterium]
MKYAKRYFEEVEKIAKSINLDTIENIITILIDLKTTKGRLFFIGVGGSAANCTHAVNDFRKIGGIESYTPNDNVAELTARTNDEGWDTVYAPWLKCSNLNNRDVVFVFSVGGGNRENNISVNIVKALQYTKKVRARIIGITGRDGGYTKEMADACIVIPTQSNDTITPHAESWQSVIWHMIVTDPRIMVMSNKWESLDRK